MSENMNACERCMARQPRERRDKHFSSFMDFYKAGRPTPINTHEDMQDCFEYAESMLRDAFDAGYAACKEDVSIL